MKVALGWPTRAAAAVALAAWAYIITANNSLEVEPVADDHWPANAIDYNITANATSWRSVELDVDDARRDAIRTEFAWSWHAVCHTGLEPRTSRPQTSLPLTRACDPCLGQYERYAWTRDELKPLSQTGADWVPGGMGLSILDNLDTLWLMGLDEEYDRARSFVQNLSFNINAEVNTFETTIRALAGAPASASAFAPASARASAPVLLPASAPAPAPAPAPAGLLSAHALTGDELFLTRALDLGKRLLSAFKTDTQLPAPNINLKTRKPGFAHWSYNLCTAEMGTLSLEFAQLSDASGDARFVKAVTRVSDHLARAARRAKPHRHLLPIFFQSDGTPSTTDMVSLGARGDSYYEYLLKAWLQTGRTDAKLRARYDAAVGAMSKHLVQRTSNGVTFVAEAYPHGPLRPKMDHLACFLPGVLALGATTATANAATTATAASAANAATTATAASANASVARGQLSAPEQMQLAEELMETCWLMYARTPTGLAAEIAVFHTDGRGGVDFSSSQQDRHSLLRPETTESLFVMWRLTKDPKYRARGWVIFEAFRSFARVESGGYASVESVYELQVQLRDSMETFWLSETLKYLWLLFSEDDLLPLDEWVLNTQAHPLPIRRKAE